MIRPLLIELALFVTPFVVYVLFLWATQAGVLHPASWSLPRLTWLTLAALVLVVGSFFVIAEFSGSPPGSTYIPAHVENGKFVPAQIEPGKPASDTAQ